MARKTIAQLEKKLAMCENANRKFQRENQMAEDAIIVLNERITNLMEQKAVEQKELSRQIKELLRTVRERGCVVNELCAFIKGHYGNDGL